MRYDYDKDAIKNRLTDEQMKDFLAEFGVKI